MSLISICSSLPGFFVFNSRMFTLTENKTTGLWEDKEICFGDDKYCTNKLSGEFERYILSFGEDEEGMINKCVFSPVYEILSSLVQQTGDCLPHWATLCSHRCLIPAPPALSRLDFCCSITY